MKLGLAVACACFAVGASETASAQTPAENSVPAVARDSADKIQPKDLLDVIVSEQEDLTRKYTVEQNGILIFPFIGSVPAAGMTAQQLAVDLQRGLTQYFKDPKVRIDILRPRRIFVFGESIKSPGTYPLDANKTLLQALATAGTGEFSEVIVVRTKGAISPVFPGQDAASQVIRVNLRDLEKAIESGKLSGNIELSDGDTVFVPRVDPNSIHVVGQVKTAGVYAIAGGTTVRQAMTIAGGPTERASVGRATITRIVGDELQTARASLNDVVQPGDSLNVPERYRFPIVATAQTDLSTTQSQSVNLWNNPPGALRLGPSLSLLPSFAIRRLGVDANLQPSTGAVQRQIGAQGGPQLDLLLRMDRLRVRAAGTLDFSYYVGGRNRIDSLNPGTGLSGDYAFSRRLTLYGSWLASRAHEYFSLQVDARVRRFDHAASVGIRVQPFERLTFDVSGQTSDQKYDESASFLGTSLRETLSEHIESVVGTATYGMTSQTSISLEAGGATHRFPFYPEKDADATQFLVGTSFKPARKISGSIRAGYQRYLTLKSTAGSFAGPIGSMDLFSGILEKTLVGAKVERQTGQVWQRQFAFALIDRYGMYLRQALPVRSDVRLEAYRETYHHQAFLATTKPSSDVADRYLLEIGRVVRRIGRVSWTGEYVRYQLPSSDLPGYGTFRWWIGMSFGVAKGGLTIANLQMGGQ